MSTDELSNDDACYLELVNEYRHGILIMVLSNMSLLQVCPACCNHNVSNYHYVSASLCGYTHCVGDSTFGRPQSTQCSSTHLLHTFSLIL